MAPPVLNPYGDGFRVPLLAISPWVKQGYIDHSLMNFDSILHLMEQAFGLRCLGAADCSAKLPLQMFDFSGAPRAPIQIFPFRTAVYPMKLQSSGKLPYYGPGLGPTIHWKDPPMVPLPRNVDWS